jgi:hypothetical protein
MSTPAELMVVWLNAQSGIDALVDGRIWPEYRHGRTLSAITYTTTDTPINYAGGTTKTSKVRVSLTVFADTEAHRQTLLDAIIGDCAESSPTGLSGWTDGNGSIWHLDNVNTDIGEILSGQEVPECWEAYLDFTLGYTRP